jgi:tetratricopeptide (TPR) repeat protein
MGAVYRAYDPELDRKVALKLILAQSDSVPATVAARVRLQREAQAMAKLNHPNVIAVYDVGTYGNEVFIAMELVDGMSLSEWLERHWESKTGQSNRAWRKVRDVFLQAGHGLAAAHGVGLIHRDFKPANVLVGHDGRVRVLDFGLARPEHAGHHDDGPTPGTTGEFRRPDVDAELTVAGTVMGTPAYMAPEQHVGNEIDARADQYAYCVALYEALYRKRPFKGGSIREQYESKLAALPLPPEGIEVPLWLQEAVAKGLSVKPEQRFSTMDGLLVRLSKRPTRKPRRIIVGSAATAGVLGGALAVLAVPASEEACVAAPKRLEGVWDEGRKQEVANAFSATGVVFANGALQGASTVLDDYAGRWSTMYEEVCRTQEVENDEMAASRRACLERRLGELGELTQLFSEADAKVVEFSISAVHELNAVELCANEEALALRLEPPADPELRSAVDQVRIQLDKAQTLFDAGKYEDAAEIAANASSQAEGYDPVLAEALYLEGIVAEARGDHTLASDLLHRAAWTAVASHHDQAAARAWISLVYTVGYHQADYRYAERIAGLARASLRAAGENPELTAELLSNVAAVSHLRGQFDTALADQKRALELLETLLGPDDPRVARSLDNLGLELRALGEHEKALAAHERALGIEKKALGERHPGLVGTLNHLGNVHFAQRRVGQAMRVYQEACDIALAAYGEQHPSRADCLANLGAVDFRSGRLAEAEARHREALDLREQALGEFHPSVAAALNNLALAVAARGRHDEALAHHQRALGIKRKALDPRHPSLARSLVNVGRLLLHLESERTALLRFEEARAILEASMSADHPELAAALVGVARCELELGYADSAVEPAERGLSILEKRGSPAHLNEARFTLARALMATEADRARAIELAEQARDAYAELGEAGHKQRSVVQAWLTKHPPA